MAKMNHNPEKDIRQLANAILRYSEMPVQGSGKYTTDTQYLAEHVAPLAAKMKERYKNKWKPVGNPKPGLKKKAESLVKRTGCTSLGSSGFAGCE